MSKLIAVEVFFRDRRLKEQVFDKDRVTIGRDPTSDIHLDNAGVSRLHATLQRGEDGVSLADCGSANGSLVNLMRVSEAKVTAADNVQIGKFVLRISERDDGRRNGASSNDDGPQVPERETIRVDATRPQSVPASAPMPASGTNAGGGSAIKIGALFAAGVLAGWLISRL